MSIVEEDLLETLKCFEDHLKGTGRTTRMLESVKSGDVVVCRNIMQVRQFNNYFADKGMKVLCISCETGTLKPITDKLRGRRPNKIHFDHSWLMDHYMGILRSSMREVGNVIASLESGYTTQPEQLTLF